MKTDFDVLIVGAGMVGLALAAELGRAGFRTGVLESGNLVESQPVSVGLRVSAISQASTALLTSIGAWQRIPNDHLTPYTSMRVWDASTKPFGDRALVFNSADVGALSLGCIVENQWLQWALTDSIREMDNVTLLPNNLLSDLVIEDRYARVFCGQQEQFVTQLVIGADGARSRLRELCNIDVQQKNYQQRAIVCNVRTERSHEQTAWQRFLNTGPLAFLPLANQQCSIVWSTSEKESERLLQLDDGAFEQELSDASDHALGGVTLASARAAFPLSMQHARRYAMPCVALVGDAAHVVHPLAGQGVNLGLGDVRVLSAELQVGKDRGDRCGDLRELRAYERERKYENRKMMLAFDSLQRLFAAPQPWIIGARSLGMGLVNNSQVLKQFFAHQAMA